MANGKAKVAHIRSTSSAEETSAAYWRGKARQQERELSSLRRQVELYAAAEASLRMSRRAWKRKAMALTYAVHAFAEGKSTEVDLRDLVDLTEAA